MPHHKNPTHANTYTPSSVRATVARVAKRQLQSTHWLGGKLAATAAAVQMTVIQYSQQPRMLSIMLADLEHS